MDASKYWQRMDALVRETGIVIDRPRGTAHPRYPNFIYPYDYGYLKNTQAADLGGIDVWAGSQPERGVTAVICTVDSVKHDAEIKILWGCSTDEARAILQIHNEGSMAGILLMRPGEEA